MAILSQLSAIENFGTLAALEKLAEIYLEARENPQMPAPYSTLFLKSGLSMRGQVVALSQDAGPRSVLFTIFDSKVPEPADLTYILCDQIAAITVHGAVHIVDQLSDGRVSKPLGPPPARGDIARGLKSMMDDLNAVTGAQMAADINAIPESAPAEVYQALVLTIRDLLATLRKLAGEELGRQALSEKNFQISFTLGDFPGVQIQKSKMNVVLGVQGNHVQRVTRESLRNNIAEFL